MALNQSPGTILMLDLDERKYHSDNALSKSSLDVFIRSPFHFWKQYRSGDPPKRTETQALRDGQMVHMAMLEPRRFKDTYVRSDFSDKRTKVWKEAAAAAEKAGKILLTVGESELVNVLTESVANHKTAASLIFGKGGLSEVSAFAIEPDTRLRIRGRIDLLRPKADRVEIIDLKTAQDASPAAFAKSVRQWGYHRQEAMYRRLVALNFNDERPITFTFVVVEKTFPYAVGVYRLSESDYERGWEEVSKALHDFKAAEEANIWPHYAEEKVHEITAFTY